MKEIPRTRDLELDMLGSFIVFSEDLGNYHQTPRVISFLDEDDFVKIENQVIFSVIKNIVLSGAVVNDASVMAALANQPLFKETEGFAKIDAFLDYACQTNSMSMWPVARALRKRRIIREIERGFKLYNYALETSDANPVDEFRHHLLPVLNIPADIGADDTMHDAKRVAESLVARNSAERPIPTGYYRLDGFLKGGLKREWLVVIGARPSVGKTTFAINVINNVLKSGFRVMFFTLEMSPEEIAEKIISLRTQTPTDDCGRLPTTLAIREEIEKFENEPIVMFNQVKNVHDLTEKALGVHKQKPVDIIVIDYLQFIPQSDPRASRFSSVTEISVALKNLAKKTGVPVIALSQLSRPPSQAEESHPTLKDLRESGQIEQDANVVVLLSRDPRENESEVDISGTRSIHVNVAKNRHGAIGESTFYFRGATSTFSE